MLFLARITNKPNVEELKKANLQQHLTYLKDQSDKVLLSASSVREHESKNALAFYWIIEADDFEEADKIVHDDPFWVSGMRQSADITYLIKALPDQFAQI